MNFEKPAVSAKKEQKSVDARFQELVSEEKPGNGYDRNHNLERLYYIYKNDLDITTYDPKWTKADFDELMQKLFQHPRVASYFSYIDQIKAHSEDREAVQKIFVLEPSTDISNWAYDELSLHADLKDRFGERVDVNEMEDYIWELLNKIAQSKGLSLSGDKGQYIKTVRRGQNSGEDSGSIQVLGHDLIRYDYEIEDAQTVFLDLSGYSVRKIVESFMARLAGEKK